MSTVTLLAVQPNPNPSSASLSRSTHAPHAYASSTSPLPPPRTIRPEPIDIAMLRQAALDVHFLLDRLGLEHVFLGTFAMIALGYASRTTDNVDVAVRVPTGLRGLVRAFKDHGKEGGDTPEQRVLTTLSSTESRFVVAPDEFDVVRITHWPSKATVHIFYGDDRIPKGRQMIDICGVPLPFLTSTHMLIEKIRACVERSEARDASDALWVYRTFTHGLDRPKIRKKLTPLREISAAAKQNHEGREKFAAMLDTLLG